MKLSKEEQEVILKLRQEKEDNTAKLDGFLKEDLFYICHENYNPLQHYVSSEEKKEIIDSLFKLALPAGSRFFCIIENKRELWFDDANYGVEEMDAEWAKRHLKDIRKIK